jgi:hypothetical protein
VRPNDPFPTQHKQRTQYHKDDERQMQRNDGVGGNAR